MIFPWTFSFIVLYFSLVLFEGIVRKQLTKKYTFKKCTLGCIEGALKQSRLEPVDMFYQNSWRITGRINSAP